MNDTTTTHATVPRRPVAREDDTPAGIPHVRGVARRFAGSLDPALASEAAETLALVVCEPAPNALRHGGGFREVTCRLRSNGSGRSDIRCTLLS